MRVQLFARRDMRRYRERMRRLRERIIQLIREDESSGRAPAPISLHQLKFMSLPMPDWTEPLHCPPRRKCQLNRRHQRRGPASIDKGCEFDIQC
jgi:hypothetical protein